MKLETKNLFTQQNWKNQKGSDKAKKLHITKIQMRMF